jgi:endonuclease/exonuclease/phosphatase family metal-dependent hydrolase
LETKLKNEIRVMTSNIRFDNPKDGIHQWKNRKEVLREMIEDFSPDLLSTQEGYRPQIESLDECLPHLNLVSSHREWIKDRMYPSLFFNPKTVEKGLSGDFWLSETPFEPGSKSFKSAFPRLCTWASLKIKSGQHCFLAANCHLDHVLSETREGQIKVLLEEIKKIKKEGEGLILMGDFNDHPQSKVRHIIKEIFPNLYDPWPLLNLDEEPTHHSFNGPCKEGSRIDWILVDKRYKAINIFLDKRQIKGIFPSDHFPLKANILF